MHHSQAKLHKLKSSASASKFDWQLKEAAHPKALPTQLCTGGKCHCNICECQIWRFLLKPLLKFDTAAKNNTLTDFQQMAFFSFWFICRLVGTGRWPGGGALCTAAQTLITLTPWDILPNFAAAAQYQPQKWTRFEDWAFQQHIGDGGGEGGHGVWLWVAVRDTFTQSKAH